MNRDNDKGKVLIRRSVVMAAMKLLLLLVIIARLYYLQVYQSDKYRTLADENRISTRILIPPRGIIYDRNGEMLANNQQNFQVLLVAEQSPNVPETLEKFRKIMPLTDEEIDRVKKDLKKNKSFVPVKIKDKLSWEEVSRIQLSAPDLPGIIIDEGLTRYYPYGPMLSHVIGYVSAVSGGDAKDDPLLEVPGFKIGKTGIEKMFEKKLRGKGGNLQLEVNAYGRVMKEIERTEGIAGDSIELSLDARLQKKAYELFGEESGALLLLDVHTGEILAFVSMPSFDPNMIVQGVNAKEWRELLNNERKPLSNKVITGQYSPGSTFKMLVALAGLESGIIRKDTKTYCSGKTVLGNHTFHCWKKEGHGPLDVVGAIQHSCDIYFYEVAQKVGIDKIAEMARRFGLGSKIGIGFDGEKEGLIPDRDWKMKRFGEAWQKGESLISGIGQGYVLTTPVQLATMTARIVNGGTEIKPTFIKPSEEELAALNKIKISKNNIETVKEGMYSVVNVLGGTAYMSQFDYNGQRMAGKTGTTQVRRISMKERQSGILKDSELPWHLRNHALFVGYVPHDNPRYAVAVLVEHGGGGSTVAAPIASKILLETLKLDPSKKVMIVQ